MKNILEKIRKNQIRQQKQSVQDRIEADKLKAIETYSHGKKAIDKSKIKKVEKTKTTKRTK